MYNKEDWKIGQKVKLNPEFGWSSKIPEEHFKQLGEVDRHGKTLIVKWTDGSTRGYSYPDRSLLKVGGYLPDELFEI